MAINEYRRHAADCVIFADNAVKLETKVSMLGLAEAWLELARRAENPNYSLTEATAARGHNSRRLE
ncbi:MAG: hypothetical protein WBZ51_17630 [Xanthobacteraceae bacterium]